MKWTDSLEDSIISALRSSITNMICLYGAGDAGRLIYKLLSKCNVKVDCFLDNNPSKWGINIVDGIKCFSPGDIAHKEHCLVMVCINWRSYQKLYSKAERDGFNSFLEIFTILH